MCMCVVVVAHFDACACALVVFPAHGEHACGGEKAVHRVENVIIHTITCDSVQDIKSIVLHARAYDRTL